MNWNAGADRDGMIKSQLKKSILKFRQYYEAKREVGPNKTSKEPACRNLKTKGATILRLQKNKSLEIRYFTNKTRQTQI